MEQEVRVVEIRKNILPPFLEKQSENLPEKYQNCLKKCIVQIVIAQSPPNLFCLTSHSSKSARGNATSLHNSKLFEKKASALSNSSYSATGSSKAFYLSVIECRKSAEHTS